MNNVKYEAKKMGRAWYIFALSGAVSHGGTHCVSDAYPNKAAAQVAIIVGEGIAAAFKAAVTDWPTALDYLAMETAFEVIRETAYLRDAIERVQRDSERDLANLAKGYMPYYSEGSYARSAVEVDIKHVALKAKWEKLRAVAYAIKQTAPTSKAGVAIATAWAFASLGNAS